jgi:hypothetical protein
MTDNPNPTPETLEVMLNEIHKAKGQFVGWALFIRRLRAHLVSWRADRKRLETLRPYLRHGSNCPSRGMPAGQVLVTCDCGLNAALAKQEEKS